MQTASTTSPVQAAAFQSKERYVLVGVVALAVLTAMALAHGLEWVWVYAALDDPPILSREITLTRVISYGLSAVAAVVVLKHPGIHKISLEVVEELSKVTWPTRQETSNATRIVIITVLVASAYLGVFDAFWLWLTNTILGAG